MEQLAISDATDLCQFMQQRLSYTNQQQRKQADLNGFWWKTLAETLRDGHGFCYDLAAFALHHLQALDLLETKLLFVAWGDFGKASNSGHFVCTFQQDQDYYCIDNGFLKGPLSLAGLLKTASRNRAITVYKWFLPNEICYHLSYLGMNKFVKNAC